MSVSLNSNTAFECGGNKCDKTQNTYTAIANRTVFNSGFYALAAYTLSYANPVVAAVYGATSALARTGIRHFLEKEDDRFVCSMLKSDFIYASAAAAGALFMGTVGMPITFNAAFGLTSCLWLTNYFKCLGNITK